ncbi:MAG TPA: hypothetical protein VLB02_00400 [Candidatus Paceibacterota bacterium]|nr:hypothetical protein [Candidatus Paceibacterota bacterium]
MDIYPQYGGLFLSTEQSLKKYQQTVPRHTLHFAEVTSLRRTYANIFTTFDKKKEGILLTPYSRKEKIRIKKIKEEEERHNTLRRGSLKIFGLDVDEYEQLGGPLFYNQQNEAELPNRRQYPKFMHVIYKFQGVVKDEQDQLFPGPNGLPVWVHYSLLPLIFEVTRETQFGVRKHSQFEAYALLKKWLGEQMVSTEFCEPW